MFVRVEEFLIGIAAKSVGECALCPIKRHRVFIITSAGSVDLRDRAARDGIALAGWSCELSGR